MVLIFGLLEQYKQRRIRTTFAFKLWKWIILILSLYLEVIHRFYNGWDVMDSKFRKTWKKNSKILEDGCHFMTINTKALKEEDGRDSVQILMRILSKWVDKLGTAFSRKFSFKLRRSYKKNLVSHLWNGLQK